MNKNKSNGGIVVFATTGKRLSTVQVDNKKTSRLLKNNIEHVIFKKLGYIAKELYDSDWEVFFNNAYYGSFPKKFKYDKTNLYYKYKNKVNTFKIDDSMEANEQLYNDCKKFITNFSGIVSEKDQNDALTMEQAEINILSEQSYEEQVWGDISSQQIQNLHLEVFAKKIASINNLSPKVTLDLIRSLINANFNKKINTEHIVMKDGKITEISLLQFSNGLYFLNISPTVIPKEKIKLETIKEDETFLLSCSKCLTKQEKNK